MSHEILKINYDELKNEYEKPGSTLSSLAKKYNTSHPTIRKWLISYNIERKSHLQASQEANHLNAGTSLKRRLSNEIVNKLDNYSWIYQQRIILKKSAETIAYELNISTASIYTAFKYHNLPKIKLNESEYLIKIKLENKKELEELYNEGLTLEKIAKNLGSSKATVSLFFKKHNIPTKDPNSYEKHINKASKKENEVADFISSLNFDCKRHKKCNTGMESDIYIENKQIAFEFNGLYYHSDIFKNKNYHLNKTNAFKEKGIRMIHIWEDDWDNKKEIIKSMICNVLGKTKNKIYARKCFITVLDYLKTKTFLDNNHIQGYTKSSINIGLLYENEIVGCMTFNIPRFNKIAKWELIRYATKLNTNILGGFSKLLSYFKKIYDGSIISYADYSYSQGNVYLKNGFKLIKINPPSYFYVTKNFNQRLNRTMLTKKKLKDFNQKMSENEITKKLGLHKIWNCGVYTFFKLDK